MMIRIDDTAGGLISAVYVPSSFTMGNLRDLISQYAREYGMVKATISLKQEEEEEIAELTNLQILQ
jgi:hypothetical protein